MIQKPSEVITRYNSNLFRSISLNQLIDECNEFSRKSYLNGYNMQYLNLWRTTLLTLRTEIYTKLNPKEKLFTKNIFKKAKEIGAIIQMKKTEEGGTKILNTKRFNNHWKLLHWIQEKLIMLADKHGMLMTNQDIDTDFMGDMD